MLSTSDTASDRLYPLRLDQVFERGNKRALRTQAAAFQGQAAEAQVLDTLRTQVFQLRQTYFLAVLTQDNVRMAREHLALTTNTERLIITRVTAGDAPEWDLITFQVSKVHVQRDLAGAR